MHRRYGINIRCKFRLFIAILVFVKLRVDIIQWLSSDPCKKLISFSLFVLLNVGKLKGNLVLNFQSLNKKEKFFMNF